MNPKWIIDGDDAQQEFLIVSPDDKVAVGTMDTIATMLHDAEHYGMADMGIKAVYRFCDGKPVKGKIVSSSDGWRYFPDQPAVKLVTVYLYGPDRTAWGVDHYSIYGK